MNRVPEYRPAPMSLAQRAALRSQEPYSIRRSARRPRIWVIVVLLVLLLLALVVGGFEFVFRDRIFPNVYVGAQRMALGGQTHDDAAAQLHQFSLGQVFRVVVLIPPHGTPIQRAAYRLGYSMDAGLTLQRAYAIGHDGSILNRLETQLRVLVHGETVAVAQHVDQTALHRFLLGLAHGLNRAPQIGVPGRQLNVATAQRRLTHLLLGGRPFTYPLPFTRVVYGQ